jgi:hypothetical protein
MSQLQLLKTVLRKSRCIKVAPGAVGNWIGVINNIEKTKNEEEKREGKKRVVEEKREGKKRVASESVEKSRKKAKKMKDVESDDFTD